MPPLSQVRFPLQQHWLFRRGSGGSGNHLGRPSDMKLYDRGTGSVLTRRSRLLSRSLWRSGRTSRFLTESSKRLVLSIERPGSRNSKTTMSLQERNVLPNGSRGTRTRGCSKSPSPVSVTRGATRRTVPLSRRPKIGRGSFTPTTASISVDQRPAHRRGVLCIKLRCEQGSLSSRIQVARGTPCRTRGGVRLDRRALEPLPSHQIKF